MEKYLKVGGILISSVVILFFVFGVGFEIGKKQVVCPVCAPEDLNFSLFWEALKIAKEDYVSPQKINTQEIIYGAISGMLKSLKDPYTVFFNPEDAKKFLEDVSGSFEGIGAEIGIKKGQLQVIAPLEGSPASKAGLKAGDQIIKIGAVVASELTVEEAVSLIRGARGTEVALTIFRDTWDRAKEIKIERDLIKVPSLKLEFLSSGKDGDSEESIAYLKLYQFSQQAASDFSKVSMDILKSPAKKIILDLRNNPGGYLEVAQNIAGWFLNKGEIVVIEDFGQKKEEIIYKAKGNAQLLDYPMVILINQGTASASEILAAALKENHNVTIVGEKSFGKGSVQELKDLSDGSSMKITVANWLTPKRNLIADVGLEPDVKIEITEQDLKEEKDPQLEKAIEIISEIR